LPIVERFTQDQALLSDSYWARKFKGIMTKDYEKAVSLLDKLIDIVGENEKHPLASLMELLGGLIEQYEDLHVAEL